MNLTRLDLFAFKSFPQRTEVEFPPGVTCVVGPNGSGKSNISDAILWVLGESNVRHLRGDRAQDVIFSGTDKRRPLAMAEASLTFDNSERRLGRDDPEITVTRRVYRNGEGEYFINRTPCRLKDIHELFLDTGIGRDAYNMVNQQDVDAILSARAEERRQLFEEAAGIKKYRVRKNEALRKLESTSANLVRLTDILAEVERTVGPLERAAAVAREFRALEARRAELERVVLAHDAAALSAVLLELTAEADALSRQAETARAARAETEAREATLRLRLTELERALDEDRARLEGLRADRIRREADRAILSQRREEAARRESELAALMDTLAARLEAAQAQNTAAEARASELSARQEDLRGRLDEARAESQAEREALEAASRRLAALRAEEARLRTAAAARDGEARAARAESERLRESLRAHEARTADLQQQAAAAAAVIAESGTRLDDLAGRRDALARRIAELEANGALLTDEARARENSLAEARRAAAELSARRRALAEMAEQHEGFYAGVRAVLEASREGSLSPNLRAVADVIQTPPGLETAIENALGGQLQDILCPSDRDAKNAIAFLKSQNAGRATFLPLDLIRPAPRVAIAPAAGVVGWAADLVSCPPEYAPAMELLLGRLLVVENLDDAVAIVRRDRPPIRVVSRDGEIVSGQGSITGGRGKGARTNLLARKRELAELEERAAAAESEAAALESSLAEAKVRLAACDEARQAAASERQEVRVETVEAERRLQYAEAESRRLARDRDAHDAESRAAAHRAEELANRAAELASAAEGAARDLEATLADRVAVEKAGTGPSEDRRRALTALEVEAAAVRERLNAARSEVARAAETARLTRDDLNRRAEQAREARGEAGASGATDEEIGAALAALERDITGATACLESRRGARDGALAEIGALREQAHATGQRAEAAMERLRKVDARLGGLSGERAHLLSRLREILHPETTDPDDGDNETGERPGVSEEEATGLLAEVELPPGFSRHAAVIEMNRLKRQIAALGPVNLTAEDEYEQANERQGFLRMQRDDLVNAEDALRRAIREIDDSTRETFLQTFHRVREQFNAIFRRLFGGGETRLELTDPDDLLETGVEIIVQPPGKRMQNLQLLSGGERALTAAALLFAFLRVKPSPFVVLDEVDAPLDEANVGRFAALLREFAEQSQFIVITHNRGTMEAADALYGVTMGEPGVSSLVSLRLEERRPPHTTHNGATR